MSGDASLKRVEAGTLDIAYLEQGPEDGAPVVLLHGFPYGIDAYEAVAARLAASGFRTFAPFLRGFGATRFRRAETPRSGQQAALAQDLLAFLDALGLPSALLGGFDWGGRAACIAAA
ncbi:MAG TPA: alpha/beta fold hydrolase, partial [Holophagaceae bacterium]|nr:alpha/beta fold hydrolase [Holophagaceae bacterium]